VRAIDGVTLRASAGEVVGLIGPNGAGKTTLFDLACGVVAPTRGRVRLNGEDVTYLPTAARAARGLVRTFQDADLFPTFTVSEVIALALERRHPSSLTSSVIGGGRGERTKRARANELVGLLGLEPWADAPVHTLSTGTRRVTELACMLALEPRVLLLDEPSAGLAQRETEALVPLLRNVHERLGVPMILIEHDLALVMGLAHRIVVLAEGCIVAEGTPAAISADPQARAALGMSAADALAPEPA
jgi:ABC-type branched-subunit amino acid transport system ATPase component